MILFKKFLILIITIHLSPDLWANQVVATSKKRIAFTSFGNPPVKGFWEISAQNNPLKLIRASEYNSGFLIEISGSENRLIERTKKGWIGDGNGFARPEPTMKKSDCSKVDLINKSGPVRQQMGGSCYAYAATELLNFNQKEIYSAAYFAQTQNQSIKRNDYLSDRGGLSSGNIMNVLKRALIEGACPEEIFPSISWGNRNNQDYLLQIENNYDELKSRDDNLKFNCSEAEIFKTAVLNLFPNSSVEDIKEVFSKTNDQVDYLREMAMRSCRGKMIKDILPGKDERNFVEVDIAVYNQNGVSAVYEDQQEKLIGLINKQLDAGQLSAIKFVTDGLIKNLDEDETHNLHASVIVGRKWEDTNPAGCYFVVKNSWGVDWRVPKNLKAKNIADHPGYFLISEESLKEYVYGAIGIQ